MDPQADEKKAREALEHLMARARQRGMLQVMVATLPGCGRIESPPMPDDDREAWNILSAVIREREELRAKFELEKTARVRVERVDFPPKGKGGFSFGFDVIEGVEPELPPRVHRLLSDGWQIVSILAPVPGVRELWFHRKRTPPMPENDPWM